MDNTITYLSIDDLIFDPENPRLPQSLRKRKGEKTYENEVIEWMMQYENIIELMGSIAEKGYFPAEPLLVVKSGDKFEVIEGNRRLTAVKILNNPELTVKRKNAIQEIIVEAKVDIPNQIPSLIFDSRDVVIAYLGYRHITGVQSWDSLAKARYLKQLLATLPDTPLNEQCRSLAKIIGSKTNYVKLLLIGVDIYENIEENDFFDIPELSDENFQFGVFYTAIGKNNIGAYIKVDFTAENPLENLNIESLKDLTTWLFKKNSEGFTRLGESRNLNLLNKILDRTYPKALEAFKEGRPLDDAIKLTDQASEVFTNSINEALNNLETAREYEHLINETTDSQLSILKEINLLAISLHKLLKVKNEESNDGMEKLD
jgi:hypothetical protein